MSSKRPPNLIYGLEDTPPFAHLILLGLQYLCMMFPYLIIVVIIDKSQGIQNSDPISFSLIALGFSTLLQVLRKGPIGSGYLAPPVVASIYFPASIAAAAQGGLPLVYGMAIFAGLVEMVFAFFIRVLRKYFPPIVCGLIILAVGIQLGLLAISQTLSITFWSDPLYSRHLLAGCLTFSIMMTLTIWAKGSLRLLAPFIGVILGFIGSFFLGIVPPLDSFHKADWFSIPRLEHISYSFSPSLALSFFLAAIASSLRVVGGVTTSQRINDPAWNRPNLSNIRKGILADGIGCAFAGLLGVPGINMAPSLIGVSQATGVTSRAVAYCLAVWLFALAFLPKIIYLFLAIPLCVIGSALLFTASFMVAGGIDLITSRKLDVRAILTLGASLILGLSQTVFPDFYANLPSWLKPFTNSVLSVVTLSAFFFNLLFRIAVQERVSLEGVAESPTTLQKSLEAKAKTWDVPKETIQRMIQSADNLSKQLPRGYIKEGSIHLDLIHDPVEMILVCTYKGTLPVLSFNTDKDKELVEESSFTEGLANYVLGLPVDQIETSTQDSSCTIKLRYYI